jgi:hypothetical protein
MAARDTRDAEVHYHCQRMSKRTDKVINGIVATCSRGETADVTEMAQNATRHMNENQADSSDTSIGWWASWWLRADPWPVLLLAIILMLGCIWEYSSPTWAMVGLAYPENFCFGSFLFSLVAACRGVQILLRDTFEARLGIPSNPYRSRRWFWPWLLLIAAGTYGTLNSQVLMNLGFILSRPALDDLADQAVADPGKATRLAGRWAGVYYISKVEVTSKTVILYTGSRAENDGFVRAPGAIGEEIFKESGFASKHRDCPIGRRVSGDWFAMYSWPKPFF